MNKNLLEITGLFICDIEWLPLRKGNKMTEDELLKKTKELGWKPFYNLEDYISDTFSIKNGKN